MSVNILKEFLLHFNCFRNLDMVNQGLYQIKSKVYYTDKNSNQFYALPYFFSDSKENENNLQTDEHTIKPHNIISNHISENNFEYITKTFLIRYSDEEIDLDEFCYFRFEVPQEKLASELTYYIEFELFFSDLLMSLKDKKGQNVLNNVEFKSVSNSLISVFFNGQGFISSYCPIYYTDSFASVLNVSVHMIVLDYKLRIDNILPYSIQDNSKQEKTPNLKQKKNISSLIEFFINDSEVNFRLDDKTIDEIYQKWVFSLVRNFLILKSRYNKIVAKLLDEKMKSEFPFFLITVPLTMFSHDKDEIFPSINPVDPEIKDYNQIQNDFSKLSARISDKSSEAVSARILYEINYVAGQIYQLWHKYIELLRFFPNASIYCLQNDYLLKYREDLSKFIKRSIVSIKDNSNLLIPEEINLAEINKSSSISLRKNICENFIRPYVEIMTDFIKPKDFPILFEESYQDQSVIENKNTIAFNSFTDAQSVEITKERDSFEFRRVESNTYESDEKRQILTLTLHLVVLVHGFQGNSYDMKLIKNNLGLVNSSLVFLSSNANQDDTECDFEEMGKRLANEVRSYLKEWSEGGILFKKISFVGHSIGGLIIRSALPHLMDYSEKFFIFMSLSTPHLGYVYSSSTIVDAGLWLLKTWKKSKSLQQLSFSDEKELRDCFLFKLSALPGLEYFKHIYLISSHQDLYAPYESTRIQLCQQALQNNSKAEFYRNMAFNILSKINREALKRVDVNFVIPEKNLDSFIGRTAHIQFLENTSFMKILFHSMEEILK